MSFKKELVGVLGQPVDENPSELMVQAAFDHHGLKWRYLTIEVEPARLAEAVRGARAMGFAGFNCTIPHKVAVQAHLDEIAPSAALIGAVNCVVRRDERLVGENTDGRGLVEALRRVTSPAGQRVVMLGAGGAARAIAVELALAGARSITLINRDETRGRELTAHLLSDAVQAQSGGFEAAFLALGDRASIPAEADIVVNATSIGLFPDVEAELPIDLSSLDPRMLVVDVIPNPPETRFIKRAKEMGCRTIDGLEMLVEQGRIGVQLWTGHDPDSAVMRGALETYFGS